MVKLGGVKRATGGEICLNDGAAITAHPVATMITVASESWGGASASYDMQDDHN